MPKLVSSRNTTDSMRGTNGRIRHMSEEVSNLATMRAAPSPNTIDLRRIGAHPDQWYPLAWSDELKPGKTLKALCGRSHCALPR